MAKPDRSNRALYWQQMLDDYSPIAGSTGSKPRCGEAPVTVGESEAPRSCVGALGLQTHVN